MSGAHSVPRILLVEDNPGDVRLTQEALKEGEVAHELDVATDGEQALDYLFREGEYADQSPPDLILLDLNLPKCDGREVLKRLKEDETLRHLPVVVLTTSEAEQDIEQTYELNANCYITKPVDLTDFMEVVRTIEDFWLEIAELPSEVRP